MANIQRNFVAGRMNKTTDKRLVANGEYIDALNIRLGSTEKSEVGTVQNSKGNTKLTSLQYNGFTLSNNATCIGAYEDGANETLYWLIHDPTFPSSPTGKIDLICSYDTKQDALMYNVISINDGGGINTTLNFNPKFLFTGIDLIGNLFFFTNDYNPPRKINITRTYTQPIAGVDGFSEESILVIRKPPVESPKISLLVTDNENNFLENRFLCFAYRYLYEDNEYSSTSQFSDIAFNPSEFDFNATNYLNNGMLNIANAVEITFNTGGPLVVGIDLLFKESNSSVIKVIKKLSKENLGYADDYDITYTFDNSEIYTILPESEILRLYDNVPRFAKAQTIMGNRLVYGNYIDGYDLVDNELTPIKLEYTTDLVSENVQIFNLPDTSASGVYSINGSRVIPNSVINIDFSGVPLTVGSYIYININFSHHSYSGTAPLPTTASTEEYSAGFSYILIKSYASVYELATSDEFINYIGTSLNIQTIANSCNGITFTDTVNCPIPGTFGTAPAAFQKTASGITAINQPVKIIASSGSNVIGLQLISMQYVNTTTTQTIYEYYSITYSNATYQLLGNSKSLHSNRGYEVGIVYMDEFNRSSTALLSPESTEYVPCSSSLYTNSIKVTIPPTQKPPYWATRYKFVIKPDDEGYNTIYTNIFFTDPNTNSVYFLLEGENATKIEAGDELIVKADVSGPTTNCVYTTVLEKSSQVSGFLDIPNELDPTKKKYIPGGVYMKINANNFNTAKPPNAIITPGILGSFPCNGTPVTAYPMNLKISDTLYEDYTVPSGSVIKMYIEFYRRGSGDGDGNCEKRIYTLNKTFTSLGSYDNMYYWFNGENIAASLKLGDWDGGGGAPRPSNIYVNPITESITDVNCAIVGTNMFGVNSYGFHRNTVTKKLQFWMHSGTPDCTGWWIPAWRKESKVTASFEIVRANTNIIFETRPQAALPDIFFENSQSQAIIDGNHQGNIQNQNIFLDKPAIIDTGFFNCFTFGNGAESYRILDSMVGRAFNLGERVTSTSSQDYKEADRFAGMTYSGVFNAENNINKLNEFNLGLLNFKNLEVSFGSIEKLHARETDILTLQEDRISYVLTGKNLLSDASGGGALTSIPEVLGTQIARIEEFGISQNPESFVAYGYDKYFTDAKRGAVIQLKGGDSGQEQLNVISDMGMRTWFRDLFMDSFNTQKLGGYDPYMNEYVLSSNSIQIPKKVICSDCGVNKTFYTVKKNDDVTFCTNFGSSVGTVDVVYEVNSVGTPVDINILYNGNNYNTGYVTTGGTISFEKNVIEIQTAQITITTTADTASVNIIDKCPEALVMTVVQVCLTSNVDVGQFIHNEYRYFDGAYTSPLQSTLVTFTSAASNPIVSQYSTMVGKQGTGAFPADLSNVRLLCNKKGFDDFAFDYIYNNFKYLRSNTLYGNNATDINTLITIANNAEPIVLSGAPNTYYADFEMPNNNDKYLYLIYDYRDISKISLCYSADTSFDACCGCEANPIEACYAFSDSLSACCNCIETPAYEMNLCKSTLSCNIACIACD
jgi:hypothetical protein